jgi:hypothetical protein
MDNKLKEYKVKNNLRWFDMQNITGISSITLQKICKMTDWEDMKWISLGTYKTLKEKLNVDLLN